MGFLRNNDYRTLTIDITYVGDLIDCACSAIIKDEAHKIYAQFRK